MLTLNYAAIYLRKLCVSPKFIWIPQPLKPIIVLSKSNFLTSQMHVPFPARPCMQLPWMLHIRPDHLGQAEDTGTGVTTDIIIIQQYLFVKKGKNIIEKLNKKG